MKNLSIRLCSLKHFFNKWCSEELWVFVCIRWYCNECCTVRRRRASLQYVYTLTRTSCTLHLSVTDTSSKRFIVQPYFWLILPKFAQIQWLVNSVLVTGLCFCIIRVTCLILLAGTNSSSVILLEIWCVGFVWVLLRCSRLKLCSHDENGWRSQRLNWSCWFEEHECFGLESFLCSSSQDDFALL